MYQDLPELLIKQTIDAEQVRRALLAAQKRAGNYRGSMFWQKSGERDYLYRKLNALQTKSMGVRTPENEKIFELFKQAKSASESNLTELKHANLMQKRMNAALRVGRVPNTVIAILEEIRKAGLARHFLVIGTNALFAYESHAGVRFDNSITTTMDVDFLWDSRKRITLLTNDDSLFKKEGLMGLLRKVDSSFVLDKESGYSAFNSKGYMVDVVKSMPISYFDDKESNQITKNENDFWAAKIPDMRWLLSAPRFEQPVIGLNGDMADMITIDPRAFVLHKAYLSQKNDRDPMKKARDKAQAKAVFSLVNDRFPHLSFNSVSYLPAKLRNFVDDFYSPNDNDVDDHHPAKNLTTRF